LESDWLKDKFGTREGEMVGGDGVAKTMREDGLQQLSRSE
jgi:hypothetical protein